MSYINEALKKAQKEREGRCEGFGGIIAAGGERRPTRRPWVWKVLLFGAALGGLLVYYGYEYGYEAPKTLPKAASPPAPESSQEGRRPAPAVASRPEPASGRDDRELYLEALAAQRRGELREARRLYEAVLARKKDHVQALNNLGVICMLEGRRQEAIALFGKAIIVKRDYVDPYYNLACLYARSNEVEESLWYLKIAVSLRGEVKKWAEQDADLKNVVATAAFKKIREGH